MSNMSKNCISELHPAGLALFTDAESFLVELSEDDESMITGGARSVSDSRVSPAIRRRRQLAVRRRRLLVARRRRRRLIARRRGRSSSISRT